MAESKTADAVGLHHRRVVVEDAVVGVSCCCIGVTGEDGSGDGGEVKVAVGRGGELVVG